MLVSHPSTPNAGFTLIEIMISVLILSIGMLGIAGLQVAGINSSHTASTQTIAALETTNLIARIRSNPMYWKEGNSGFDIEVNAAGVVEELEVTCEEEENIETQAGDTETGYETETCIIVDGLNDVAEKNCRNEVCNGIQIAKYDLQQWANRLSKKDPVTGTRLLPFQGAIISKAAGMIMIQLEWLETEAKKQGRAVHSYQVRIKL